MGNVQLPVCSCSSAGKPGEQAAGDAEVEAVKLTMDDAILEGLPELFVQVEKTAEETVVEAEVEELEVVKADVPEVSAAELPAAEQKLEPVTSSLTEESGPKIDQNISELPAANDKDPGKKLVNKAKAKAKSKGKREDKSPASNQIKSDINTVAASETGDVVPDSTGMKLTVFVMSAHGLRDADFIGKSDPYCTLEVEGMPHTKAKTAVIHETLNPIWSEGFEIAYKPGKDLTLSVWDADWKSKDEFLGKAVLTHDQFYPEAFNGDLFLAHAGRGIQATIHVKVLVESYHASTVCDSIFKPHSSPEGLTVCILSAKGLRNADWASKSDPYCLCELSGMPKTRMSTVVANDTLDPLWNSAFFFPHIPGKGLYFEVWDKDIVKDDLLGKATLEEDAFYPNNFEGTLPLSETGKGIAATLSVKVTVNENRRAH